MERICFQVEEAQWFYEDFIRPLDPSLPSLTLRAFSLRIFQHCPLFSEWSTESYTAAFAEFLAYKSRVPVRGAILLNHDMDQVVLVKGWKKGANWSFPRGKINKDEDDLDCAVREVYEETGFDLRAAGLVKDATEMKHIEITMREQHMRLYVFRGIPLDTYFEPRTRKEISKIGWWKLHDLPTLSKARKSHDMVEERAGNPSKFYMVAPFLIPLKKWIAQQRRAARAANNQSTASQPELISKAPPRHTMDHAHKLSPESESPCRLPEVFKPQPNMADAVTQRVHGVEPVHYPLAADALVDKVKSNALLALLRDDSRSNMVDKSNPQIEANNKLTTPSASTPVSRPAINSNASVTQLSPDQVAQHIDESTKARMRLVSPALEVVPPAGKSLLKPQTVAAGVATNNVYHMRSRTQLAHCSEPNDLYPAAPLSENARTLLNVFSRNDREQSTSIMPDVSPTLSSICQTAPTQGESSSHETIHATTSDHQPFFIPMLPNSGLKSRGRMDEHNAYITSNHKANLLDLLTNGSEAVADHLIPKPALSPVELAATTGPQGEEALPMGPKKANMAATSPNTRQAISHLMSDELHAAMTRESVEPLRAKISLGRSFQPFLSSDPRHPKASNLNLFQPDQFSPEGTLDRPETNESRTQKNIPPTMLHTDSSCTAIPSKPASNALRPHILRRPISELSEAPPKTEPWTLPAASRVSSPMPPTPLLSVAPQSSLVHHKATNESHKQTLLSLFGTPSTPNLAPTSNKCQTCVSPQILASGDVSPLAERANMRSGRASLASDGSREPSTKSTLAEKRQTAAGNRAFLLSYLGKIASQEV